MGIFGCYVPTIVYRLADFPTLGFPLYRVPGNAQVLLGDQV